MFISPKAKEVPATIKLWGENHPISLTESFELHHATIREGGFSSRHKHERKFNLFYVVTGALHLYIYDADSDKPRESILLTSRERYTVPPGVFHRFEAMTNVELLESYWVSEGTVDPNDIVRTDEGGILDR